MGNKCLFYVQVGLSKKPDKVFTFQRRKCNALEVNTQVNSRYNFGIMPFLPL